jgi:predicted Zn-dependent protease
MVMNVPKLSIPPSSRVVLPNRVLGKEELLHVGNMILSTSSSDIVQIQLKHTVRAITRVANTRVLTSNNGDTLELWVQTIDGGRAPIAMTLNYVDPGAIRSAVKRLDDLARVQIGPPSNRLYIPDGPQEYMPVSLWHGTTVDAIEAIGDTVIPGLMNSLRASGLLGSGFVGVMARSTLAMQKDGLCAFNQETDAECTVHARTSDGKASGWWGEANRQWSAIAPEAVASKAIECAHRNKNPFAVEPGRRTAILSSFAMAQLLRLISRHFDAYRTNIDKMTAFAIRGNPERENKLGKRVFDPRIQIASNPADSLGGYTPFGDPQADGIALPTSAIRYVEDGVLRDLAYDAYYRLSEGKPFNQVPWSMRFEASPGTPLHSVEEMISNCEDGIYVHRFSDLDQLDWTTGMQTGVTRDGCFLIRHGKIQRPVKNFRFLDSPFFFLNRMQAIGKSERVALGYAPPIENYFIPSYASEWPPRPMIAPPVMVSDFNFSGLSDAV